MKLDINLIKLACLMLSCLINNNIFQCYFGDLIYLFRHGLNAKCQLAFGQRSSCWVDIIDASKATQ